MREFCLTPQPGRSVELGVSELLTLTTRMLPVLFLSLLSFTLHLCSLLRAFAEQVSVLTSVYREMGTLLAAKSGVREGGREEGWEGGREGGRGVS